jgi:hypothetical protein
VRYLCVGDLGGGLGRAGRQRIIRTNLPEIPRAAKRNRFKMLVEGCSVISIERIPEVHHTTILKLLVIWAQSAKR